MTLDTAELAAMQSTLDESLPDSFEIHRNTRSNDGSGGKTASWASTATVSGRLSPPMGPPGTEELVAGKTRVPRRYTLTLPDGTDITARDRVVFGSRTFEVNGVTARSWEIGRRVDLTEIL